MEFKETYLEKLLNKKAEKDNSIDLNAYALGIKDSKAPEILEMIEELIYQFENNNNSSQETDLLNEAKQLIKQATEL